MEQEPNPDNRHQVLNRLTQAGLDLLQQIDPVVEQQAKTYANLTDKKTETLSRLLDKQRG